MSGRAGAIAVAWLPVGLYCAAIWALSAIALPQLRPGFDGGDKVVHAVEFFVLGLLVTRALVRTSRRPSERAWRLAVIAFLACVGWGFLDEVHQATVPGRTASIWDLAADAVGAAMGVLAYLALRRRR